MSITINKTSKKNSISLYWKCQLIGWGIVSLLWLYIALVRDQFTIYQALINYVFDIAICIGLTHAYRSLALKSKWNQLKLKRLIVKVIPFLVLLSILFMLFMNLKASSYVYIVNDLNNYSENILQWNPVLITGLRHMSIWLLAYHAYHFYIREIRTAKENAQLSIIAKQAQLDNLSAQLNPHFLFNSLNSIKSLVIENPKAARRAIDLLSDLLRSSLYEKEEDLIPIKNELLLVKDYIELEKLRFEERLQLELDIDEGIENYKVPALSIQLLVENAIKHGIDHKVKGGSIVVSVERVADYVQITVQNPGKFIKNKKNKGLGLGNLKERLNIQYKGNADFKIEENDFEKVIATITIPITRDGNI